MPSIRSSELKMTSSACWQFLGAVFLLAFLVKTHTRVRKGVSSYRDKHPSSNCNRLIPPRLVFLKRRSDHSTLRQNLPPDEGTGHDSKAAPRATAAPVRGHQAARTVALTARPPQLPQALAQCSWLLSLTNRRFPISFFTYDYMQPFHQFFLFVVFLFINEVGTTFRTPGALPSSESCRISGH